LLGETQILNEGQVIMWEQSRYYWWGCWI